MKKIIPLLLAVLALAGCGPKYSYTQISMEEAIA
ncbi:MAG: lipoprotein, partial [Clostridia bacterium]|nr:lipoprotein [Clostridia bacterium]